MNAPRLSLLFVFLTLAPGSAQEPTSPPPAASCRLLPGGNDEFAWENDLVAFRVFGPASRADTQGSGIGIGPGCPAPSPPGHSQAGAGWDFHPLAGSRGCGGTALWREGELVAAPPYRTWQILTPGNDRCEFELTYEYPGGKGEAPIREVKRIRLALGERFFRSESTFTREGEPVADLPVAVGVSTHEGKATGCLSPTHRWVACWEAGENAGLGSGAVLAPGQPIQTREIRGHVLLLTRTNAKGVVVHYAGFARAATGGIASAKEWAAALTAFSDRQKPF